VLNNVTEILENGKPLHIVLKASLDKLDDIRDKGFTAVLTRGCVERMITLDTVIDQVSTVKVRKQKPVIRNILRMGTYQLLFMNSVTDFAAVDESVKLAGARGFGSLKGFVNAVLRKISKNSEKFLNDINRDGPDNYSYKYSVPKWLADNILDVCGSENTQAVFDYFMKENDISVRVNISHIEPAECFGLIQGRKDGMGIIRKNPYIEECFYLKKAGPVENLEEFMNGDLVIQDMSSVLAGRIADLAWSNVNCGDLKKEKSQIKVLDLCAAPGGKSLHMADLGYNVTSCDISEEKIKLIEGSVKRCRFDNIRIMINDASVYNPEFKDGFDIVICDLPCSGLGIIGKKPDIKYNMTVEKSIELSKLQKSMLNNAFRYVRKGGILLFCTCTLRECENTENVGYILKEKDFEGVPVKEFLPKGIEPLNDDDCFLSIIPGRYGSDGFFISCFRRV